MNVSLRLTALVALLACTAPRARAQTLSDAARAYLTTALDSLERTALNRASTDWQAVRDSALLLAGAAQRPAQTYGALNWALRRVDHHSFLQAPFPWVNPELLDGRFGYLRVPFHPAGTRVALADTLQQAIRTLDIGGACGWVVDLRMNGGGNVWPMYAGIGPLLPDSVLGVGPGGRATSLYVDGKAIGTDEGGQRVVAAQASAPYTLRHPEAPLAVLIDGGTGSSGEAIAIAFRTRPHTRFFGAPTSGYTTANRGITLADGANMVVTTDPMADRYGHVYPDALVPDELVPMPAGFWPSSTDAVAVRALTWLRTQAGCAP